MDRFWRRLRWEDGHAYFAPKQFRLGSGWLCSRTQAAWLLQNEQERLPPRTAVVNVCGRPTCVHHIRLVTLKEMGKLARSRIPKLLSQAEVDLIRSIPDMRRVPPAIRSMNKIAIEVLCRNLGISTGTFKQLRTPYSRARHYRRGS